MSGKIKYTDEDIGEPRVIPNFLPPPDQLVLREDSLKVTIALSRKSIEFFKLQAKQQKTQYQKMIRNLLDLYVDAQTKSARKDKAKPAKRGPAK